VYGEIVMQTERLMMSETCKVTNDSNRTVTLELPYEAARFVKVAVENLAGELVSNNAYHDTPTRSAKASLSALNLTEMAIAMSGAGIK
jgi:hypothetical protein